MTDFSDPKFWEALGIEPIVINPNDEESIEKGLDKLDELIIKKVEECKKEMEEEDG